MENNQQVREAFREWVEMCAREIQEQTYDVNEQQDLVFQYADGSEWSIYYGKAWALVYASDSDTIDDAYADARESMPEMPEDMNDLMSRMAFHICYSALSQALYEGGDCERCHGVGRVIDPECDGTSDDGMMPCPECNEPGGGE